jgi:hypothetical protein
MVVQTIAPITCVEISGSLAAAPTAASDPSPWE